LTRRRSRRVDFLDAAVEDMRRIAAGSPVVVREVLRMLRRLEQGEVEPTPLHDYAKTGDLGDCGKLVVAVEGGPEHRVVVRRVGQTFEVCEVIAVDARQGDLAYLLAGLRLARLTDPVRRSDAQRRVDRIRRLLDQ